MSCEVKLMCSNSHEGSLIQQRRSIDLGIFPTHTQCLTLIVLFTQYKQGAIHNIDRFQRKLDNITELFSLELKPMLRVCIHSGILTF